MSSLVDVGSKTTRETMNISPSSQIVEDTSSRSVVTVSTSEVAEWKTVEYKKKQKKYKVTS